MIHLEIVGSSASPRADLISRLGLVDSRNGRMGSPSAIYTPSTPPSRRDARIFRIPSSRLKNSSRRALQRSTPQQKDNVPLPEPANEDLPVSYIDAVNNAIASYNTTPTSSGRSSPTNMETQSTLSVSQGGWTTGNTTERSSLDSSCYSLDEFDRQAASTVNQHFEEFESMLFEGPRETGSNVYRECQEWVTQFPHIRVLGKQVLAPRDTGFHFVAPISTSNNTTPRPSTSGTFDLNLCEHDLSFSSDLQGLTVSGRKLRPTKAPLEVTSMLTSRGHRLDNNHVSSEYDFLHEEIFAQDGVYEEIIAVDYKNIYEDNMEHKKQITPRRRRVGYPPITPNACVKDSVSSGAFDSLWSEIMSWTQSLVKRYAAEVESKKHAGDMEHAIPAPVFRASSFAHPIRSPHSMDGQVSFQDMLHVSRMALNNRNPLGMSSVDGSDTAVLAMNAPALAPVQKTNTNRPSTVNPHRWRQSQGRRLDPLPEPSKVQNAYMQDEGRSHQPSPQNALRVKQIVPTGPHRLSSPPNPLVGRLPPLESSSGVPSHRKMGNRASSAIDNKEGRSHGGRDKSNNAIEVSRPSTTQAFRSDTPFSMTRRSSTPLGQNIPARQLYLMSGHKALGITGSGLHPSTDPTPNILEDQEGPTREDIHHNQWIPSTPSYTSSFLKRIRMRTLRN